MTHVHVVVPGGLFAALRMAPHEAADEMRLAAAIHWYQQGRISMARAADTAGMTRPGFLAELARRRVDVFVVDEEDLARELEDDSQARAIRPPDSLRSGLRIIMKSL
jgi:predicted HTH domain antitoxin